MNIINIINEEVKRLFEQPMYDIPELAQVLQRHGYDKQGIDTIKNMLINAYRTGGDQAVIELYTQMAGVEIEAMQNGKYMFANLYNPDINEVMDNSNHTPDEMPS